MNNPQEQATSDLLSASLSAAVPLWIERLKSQPWEVLDQRRSQCIDVIASHGDNILYRSKKPGGTAKAFNALAEAIAILSFAPGGVRIFGLEFVAVHPDLGDRNAGTET